MVKHGSHHKQGGRPDQRMIDRNRATKAVEDARMARELAGKLDEGVGLKEFDPHPSDAAVNGALKRRARLHL